MPGTLTFDPTVGLFLELIGGWDADLLEEVAPGHFTVLDGVRRWPVLHGIAENRNLTLLDCLPTSTKSHSPLGGPAEQSVHILTALSGVHLDDAKSNVFKSCKVAVEDLTAWSGTSILGSSMKVSEGRPTGEAMITAHTLDDPAVAVDGVVASLVHEHALPHFEHTKNETVGRMRETRYVQFRPDVPWGLAEAERHARVLQDLLSLALHQSCGILWMQLLMPPEDREYPEGYPIHDQVIDYYSTQTVESVPNAKAAQSHEALFTCDDLPFEEIWPRWWEVYDRCRRASDMILGLRYAPARFIEGRLLTAVGAAEVLHRAVGSAIPPIPAPEFVALRRDILRDVPDQYKGWVRGKLRNDVSLRERLRALAGMPDGEAMGRLIPSVEGWAAITTRARNDLAHEGHTAHQTLDEIIVAVELTTLVVVMNLLQELGLPGDRQQAIVLDHPRFRSVRKQARDVLGSDAIR